MTLSADIRALAVLLLTEKQMEAFELRYGYGWSLQRIANHLHIRPQSLVSRLDAAALRLEKAGAKQNINGDWYMEETNAAA